MSKEFIIRRIPIPKDLKKKLDRSQMILDYSGKAPITRYQKEANKGYANALANLAWQELIMNSLNTPEESHYAYAHRVSADTETDELIFYRDNTPEPNIYEKFILSSNLK